MMALPQARNNDTTEARLARAPMPAMASWARAAHDDAAGRLRAMGLPGRRDEYWRFTDPSSLNVPEAPTASVFEDEEAPLFGETPRLKVVFVDGVFDAEASDPLAGEGLEIERLSEAMQRDIHWARDIYGVLEARGQQPVPRPFAALNTATATDGVVIRATGQVRKPVHLVYLHRSETSDATLHHVVKIEKGADLTLLETGPAAARFNKVMEVEIGDGGAFHHVRAQGRDRERRAITHVFSRLGERSVYKSFTLTVNGVLTRNEQVVELTGAEAVAHVAGACVGDRDFHHDDTVFVTHDAVACESRQVFKKVLRNGAIGVFQGKILVKPGAQQTDGYQISQSLLLDEDAQFLAKPELEIYADDVKCSHGSTSGAIDETGLFYLRSRGVPEGEATDLLVLAFLAEALAEIDDQSLADEMQDRLEAWLARRRK
jgi:Fe-S cluster assembly protein SufD